MANSYYNRIYEYTPRTKAIGQQVKDDFQGAESGFDKLPAHNESYTGFDSTFIVEQPTVAASPVPVGYMENWVMEYVKDYIEDQLNPDVPDGGLSWSAPVAKGGETVISPPYSFHMAAVYINGVMQDRTRNAFSISNNKVILSEPLLEYDEVQIVIGWLRPENVDSWSIVTEDYGASMQERIALDSRSGSFTVMLPGNPVPSSSVFMIDVGEALDSNPVTVTGNGNQVMNTDSILIDISFVSIELVFIEGFGWRLIE